MSDHIIVKAESIMTLKIVDNGAGDGSVSNERSECRVCQEEDFIHKMEAPCGCKGTIINSSYMYICISARTGLLF